MSDEETQRVETLIAVAQTACDNASKQYDDYYKTFVALDAKAQSTATIGGVVIAAVVAFVDAGKLDSVLRSSPSWGNFLHLLSRRRGTNSSGDNFPCIQGRGNHSTIRG